MMIKKYFYRLLLVSVCIGLINACGSGSDSSDDDANNSNSGLPVVNSKISDADLSVGDNFQIQISANGLPESEGGGISLRFDPAVIAIDHVDLDSSWEFASQAGAIDNATGKVSDILFTSFSGNSGSVLIATISANVVGAGTSDISIVESSVNPFSAGGSRFAVQFETATIQVDL